MEEQLKAIREEYKNIKPEEIKVTEKIVVNRIFNATNTNSGILLL